MADTVDGLKFASDMLSAARELVAKGNTAQARKTLARGIAECETPDDARILRRARDRIR